MIGIINNEDMRMTYLANFLDGKLGEKISDFFECDEIVLPVQGIDNFGYCYHTSILLRELIQNCPKLKRIYSGKIEEQLKTIKEQGRIEVVNYLSDPEVIYLNSKLTIEGFLKYLLNDLEQSLSSYKIIILGYGNLGKLLAKSLKGLQVKYAVYSPAEMKDLFIFEEDMDNTINDYDIIINTIPKNMYSEDEYYKLKDKRIYDLASYPYGFDPTKVKTTLLGGIPGKNFPKDAAKIIADFINKAFL